MKPVEQKPKETKPKEPVAWPSTTKPKAKPVAEKKEPTLAEPERIYTAEML